MTPEDTAPVETPVEVPVVEIPAVPVEPVTEPVPVPPADPDAVVGEIAPPLPDVPADVAPEFHAPTAEELAGFAPPPPIETKQPVFPLAPVQTIMGDKTSHLGLTVGHVVPVPEILTDVAPEPVQEAAFEDLPEKTQAELKAGWLRTHGTMDGFRFGGPTPTHPTVASREWPHPQGTPPADLEKPIDISKLPLQTQREMAAGKARLENRLAEHRDVLRRVSEKQAAEHDAGAPVNEASMDYAAPR